MSNEEKEEPGFTSDKIYCIDVDGQENSLEVGQTREGGVYVQVYEDGNGDNEHTIELPLRAVNSLIGALRDLIGQK